MKDTFCVLPFIHLEARADGYVAPCCMSQYFFKREDGKRFHMARETLLDVWESKEVHDLRTALKNGVKHPACASCWKEESNGKFSKRLRENQRWGDEVVATVIETPEDELTPLLLDLKFGNLCNLKCRICSPASSSKWMKEWTDTRGYDRMGEIAGDVSTPDSVITKRMIMNWFENERFWVDLDKWLPHVQHFEIYGGEPFLIERHFEMLRYSVEQGWSKNQTIHYNTNGTVYPEDAMKNLFPHFKRVDIMLSFDGVGPQYEYQRHPAKWAPSEQNMFKFLDAFGPQDVHICMTVSALNIFYIPEYLRYFKQVGIPVWLNVLYGPVDFCIQHLPPAAKEAVRQKLEAMTEDEKSILLEPIEPILTFLKNSTANPANRAGFLTKLEIHDKYRREDYSQTFPEFSQIIGYKGVKK